MKKAIILASIVILIAVFIITALAGASPYEPYNQVTTWTKAVCNGNSCIDVEISCKGDKIFDIKPISGMVQFSEGWEDTRPESFRNKWC